MISIKSDARSFAIQFLYQCEFSEILFFSANYFQQFIIDNQISEKLAKQIEKYTKLVMAKMDVYDQLISSVSKNWSLSRMSSTDRAILRLATMELEQKLAPYKVVINEAIELGKKYGSEDSSKFINGILDKIAEFYSKNNE